MLKLPFASLLGGSIIPANPIKVNEDSISSTFKGSNNARISFMA
jgi:hypothetical protein